MTHPAQDYSGVCFKVLMEILIGTEVHEHTARQPRPAKQSVSQTVKTDC